MVDRGHFYWGSAWQKQKRQKPVWMAVLPVKCGKCKMSKFRVSKAKWAKTSVAKTKLSLFIGQCILHVLA